MSKFQKFAQLQKIDVLKRQVWGVATSEAPDQTNEVMDYEHSKPHFVAWSQMIQKASGGKSKGNLRVMHQPIAAGRIIDMQMRDAEKSIYIGAEIVDNAEWQKVLKGVYTGFSIGGKYGDWMEKDGAYTRYEAIPHEISLADSPCNPEATFQVIKADGATELMKFTKDTNMDNQEEKKAEDKPTEQAAEEPVNKDGQTETEEADEHTEVMAVLDDAIANGSDEIKALAQKVKAAIQADEAAEAQAEGTEDEQATTSEAPVEGEAGMSGEAAPVDSEAIRAETIAVLEELGLVTRADGAIKAALPEGLTKVSGGDDLQKFAQMNSELERLSKDIVTLTVSLEGMEERIHKAGGVGPVLRDLGSFNSVAIAKMQEADVLRKSLDSVNDPYQRQAIQLRITELEAAALQPSK